MREVAFACPSCSQRLTARGEDLARPLQCVRCASSFKPLDVIGLDEPLPALATIPKDEAEPSAPARGGTIRINPEAAASSTAKRAERTIRMDPTGLPTRLRKPPRRAASAIADELFERLQTIRKALAQRIDPRALKLAAIVLPSLVVVVLCSVALYKSVTAPPEAPPNPPQEAGDRRSEGPLVTPAGLVMPEDIGAGSGSAAISAGGVDRSGKEGVGPGISICLRPFGPKQAPSMSCCTLTAARPSS